jgi:hypothetical protein
VADSNELGHIWKRTRVFIFKCDRCSHFLFFPDGFPPRDYKYDDMTCEDIIAWKIHQS